MAQTGSTEAQNDKVSHSRWTQSMVEAADILTLEGEAHDQSGGCCAPVALLDRLRVAYADPPYLGTAKQLYGNQHPEAEAYDRLETHAGLIARLSDEYPDGWAMSLNSVSLRAILPLCPEDVRVLAWVKPFCSFKPGVGLAYAWEPIILRGGRRRERGEPTVPDYCAANITLKRGLVGAKPEKMLWWLFAAMGLKPQDELDDLFPGSGAVSRAWEKWKRQGTLAV